MEASIATASTAILAVAQCILPMVMSAATAAASSSTLTMATWAASPSRSKAASSSSACYRASSMACTSNFSIVWAAKRRQHMLRIVVQLAIDTSILHHYFIS
jgi:hypothetical protein